MRRKPYIVVLFDEFEKAHKSIHNLLLQVLDEGHLTDSQGRKVDFRNTLCIMTSNLGADILAHLPEEAPSSQARDEVMALVRHSFAPGTVALPLLSLLFPFTHSMMTNYRVLESYR